jgi:hypothetical protein
MSVQSYSDMPILISDSDNSDDSEDMTLQISDSDDSDGPISRGARRLAVQMAQMQHRLNNGTIPQPQSQLSPADIGRQAPPVPRSPAAATATPIIRSPPPLHSPSIIRRRIIIHDSDSDEEPQHQDPTEPQTSADTTATSVHTARIQEPQPQDALPTVHQTSADTTVTPVLNARIQMHKYFASFRGCDPDRLEVEPVAAPDADLLDLRSAVPPQMPLQFLLLESAHVPANSDDSSGQTCSQSDSDMDSFCDDGDYEDTPEQILLQQNAAKWLARKLPITAAALKTKISNQEQTSQPTPPRRQRVVLSDSPTPVETTSEDEF